MSDQENRITVYRSVTISDGGSTITRSASLDIDTSNLDDLTDLVNHTLELLGRQIGDTVAAQPVPNSPDIPDSPL